ncbi:MAG: hypothetical protein H7Y11_04435, partial [Armatimonadetes bacterium]|nr:hypothetical protein [Anaerolineae bacterium]
MLDRIRQVSVVIFAIGQMVASFVFGSEQFGEYTAEVTTLGNRPAVYFLPVGITFAIWGVIFIGSLIYAVYQAQPSQTTRAIHRRVGGWAALNSLFCALWLWASAQSGLVGAPGFRPEYVWLTVAFIIGMLFAMTQAMIGLRQHAATLTRTDHWAMQVPVAIYFAWLNVATIANT